jgi:hypothetical protein
MTKSDKQKKGRPRGNCEQNKQYRDATKYVTRNHKIDRNKRKIFSLIRLCIERCSRKYNLNLGYDDMIEIMSFLIKSPTRKCKCNETEKRHKDPKVEH